MIPWKKLIVPAVFLTLAAALAIYGVCKLGQLFDLLEAGGVK